ncbi:hypothetical protein [Paenibacillus sp. NPDC057967]|uniref:hypothetical protein n=1 Tax=Paenibacillus sp. NPDC057967 TaxID=3346293 RepID=UPI0036D965A8
MAKLNVVSEGTFVEVRQDGATVRYRKVDRKAQTGDIVRARESSTDITQGAFYRVTASYGDRIEFNDNDGDLRNRNLSKYEVYEKVTEPKRLTVGDYGRVTSSATGRISDQIGSVVKIVRDDPDEPKAPYQCEDINGENVGLAFISELEPATKAEFDAQIPKPARLKVGEYAKVVNVSVIDGSTADWARINTIVEIIKDDYSDIPYSVKRVDNGETGWSMAARLVPATNEEVHQAKYSVKIGDFKDGDWAEIVNPTDKNADPVAIRTRGRVVKVTLYGPRGRCGLTLTKEDGSHAGFANADALRKLSDTEVALLDYEIVGKRNSAGSKIGDIIVFDELPGSFVSLGRLYTVESVDSCGDAQIVDDEGDSYDTCGEDFTLYRKKAEKKAAPSLKVGDTVKLSIPEGESPRYGWGSVKNGNVGKIRYVDGNGVTVDFPNQRGWNGLTSEFVIVSEDDVKAEAERLKWAAIGRKVGEYKTGDVVECIDSCSGHRIGTVGIVTADSDDYELVYVKANGKSYLHSVKLVTPVEQRFDAKGDAA